MQLSVVLIAQGVLIKYKADKESDARFFVGFFIFLFAFNHVCGIFVTLYLGTYYCSIFQFIISLP
jgi:hypothetical protein